MLLIFLFHESCCHPFLDQWSYLLWKSCCLTNLNNISASYVSLWGWWKSCSCSLTLSWMLGYDCLSISLHGTDWYWGIAQPVCCWLTSHTHKQIYKKKVVLSMFHLCFFCCRRLYFMHSHNKVTDPPGFLNEKLSLQKITPLWFIIIWICLLLMLN